MTKGYALVTCLNGHDVWGGETVEEAQKNVWRRCEYCGEDCEAEDIRYTPPRVIPPTEAEILRAEIDVLKASVGELRDALGYLLYRIRDAGGASPYSDLGLAMSVAESTLAATEEKTEGDL